jgi:hypothetical protein
MKTFAQKQNQPQKAVSSSFARSNTGILGPNHHANPLLHLQRTIGNQAVQRPLRTSGEELEAGLNAMASPLFGYDFSRIPIHPPGAATQMKRATNKSGDECEQEAERVPKQEFAVSALASMDQGLARPGLPPGSALRQDMEGSFGHDFRSGIQMRAARLSSAASPSTPVIQPNLKVGEPNDQFEQEADQVADKVMKMSAPLSPLTAISTSASVQPSSATQPRRLECARGGDRCPRCVDKEKIESNALTEPTNALIQRKSGDVSKPTERMPRKEGDKKAELEFHSTIAFNNPNSGSSSTGPSKEGFTVLQIQWVVWNTGFETAPEHVDRLTIYKADRCSGCRDEKDEILRAEVTAPATVPITQPGEADFRYKSISPMVGMTIRAGHYDVYVDIDVYDEVEEINEDNNTIFTSFFVKPRDKSDPDTEGEE